MIKELRLIEEQEAEEIEGEEDEGEVTLVLTNEQSNMDILKEYEDDDVEDEDDYADFYINSIDKDFI